MDNIDKNVTMADIARDLNVSLATVSRSLSGKGRVGAETKQRVIDYANEVGFKPNALAQSLAKQCTFNIALVVPGDSSLAGLPFFQSSMNGVCLAATEKGYDVVLAMREGQEYSHLERLIDNRKIDGVILSRSLVGDKAIGYLLRQDLPFVVMGSTSNPAVLQVDNNHQGGCCELILAFLEKGITAIGLVGGDSSHVVNQSRLHGFKDAFKKHGLTVDDSLLRMDCTTPEEIGTAVTELIDGGVKLLVGMDDIICSELLQVLRDRQLRVPDQVQVASFYDSSLLHRWDTGITALAFDDKALGQAAFEALYAEMNGLQVAPKQLLSHEIIYRGSTL